MTPNSLLERFTAVQAIYEREFSPAQLMLTNRTGTVVSGGCACPVCSMQPEFALTLAAESLRWGDAAIGECPHGFYLWAAPVTDNNELVGALVAGAPAPGDNTQVSTFTTAARRLLQLAGERNLVNVALLARNAEQTAREAAKAQAIHSLKQEMYTSVRQVYLEEEANLIAAVKTGERHAAREILNRILVGIYALGGQDFELLKALVLELVIVLYRTAVEAGGDPVELLGINYASLQDYSRISNEEELTPWLVWHLERLMDNIGTHGERPVEVQLQAALRYMHTHCCEPITRDDVAKEALMSPTYLSRSFRQKLHRGYVELLNEMRIVQARQMLLRTHKGLAEVSAESGFSDQSYFTKVFKHYTGVTPGEYRRTGKTKPEAR